MYINIGKTKINYSFTQKEDFNLLAEVVWDAKCSYETPIYVRTKEELDSWFGKEIENYDFYCELLQRNVVLYLFRPISPRIAYPEASGFYFLNDNLLYSAETNLLVEPERDTIYKILGETGDQETTDSGLSYSREVYIDDIWIPEEALDKTDTKSFHNRDTLRIMKDGTFYSFNYGEERTGSYSGVIPSNQRKYSTKFKTSFSSGKRDFGWILVGNTIYTTKTSEDSDNKEFGVISPNGCWNGKKYVSEGEGGYIEIGEDGFLETLRQNDGVSVDDDGVIDFNYPVLIIENNNSLYNKSREKFSWEPIQSSIRTYYTNLAQFSPDNYLIDFWSKTIGNPGLGGEISVLIENLGESQWRIEISRFDYTEIYEGTVYDLKLQINRNSKLVYCNFYSSELIPGLWTLWGSEKETYTVESHKQGYLELREAYFDFLLIPHPELIGYDFSCIYDQILNENNSMALITSKDLTKNYRDKESRLIYFWGDFQNTSGSWRPSYYILLLGLLEDNYSLSKHNILYLPGEESIKNLEKYYANYLLDSGHAYYYKSYQDQNADCTWRMRFTISKISRELSKRKLTWVGRKINDLSIYNEIESLLKKIKNKYSIIRNIEITQYVIYEEEGKIELSLDTEISDLVNNNISLDITLNINKNLWQQ